MVLESNGYGVVDQSPDQVVQWLHLCTVFNSDGWDDTLATHP
jgi:hypothetical protein